MIGDLRKLQFLFWGELYFHASKIGFSGSGVNCGGKEMLDSRYDDIKGGNPDARPIRPDRDRLNCPSGSLEYTPRVWGYLAENPTTNKNVS